MVGKIWAILGFGSGREKVLFGVAKKKITLVAQGLWTVLWKMMWTIPWIVSTKENKADQEAF